jgi:hypothetical protein
MRKHTRWLLALIATVAASQSAWADDYRYNSRAELYEAQAQQYVADRTRTVRPRTQYVQQRVIYMDTAPIRQRVIYPNNTRASVVRNPAYHAPGQVTVIEDVISNDRDYVFDDVITDDSPVGVRRTYIQPSHYAGYTGYSSYRGYRGYNSHVAHRSYPTYYGPYAHRSYRHYPVYRSHPVYRVGVHYNDSYRRHGSRHGYGDYHRGGYGGYGHGGYGYGGYGRYGHNRGRYGHGSNWGVSVYFDF